MSKQTFSVTAAAIVLAASTAAAAQHNSSPMQHSQPAAAVHVQAMANLERAAQRLREAIQTLAQQAPGESRKIAMEEANKALVDAQSAMAEFGPPAPRTLPARQPTAGGPQSYDEAIGKLRQASDRLYDTVHAMGRVPAGERRNAAIHEVNEALLNTQIAMGWAADEKFASAPASAATYAAGRATATHPSNAMEDKQARLKQAGLYNGPIDGRMSGETRQALKAFQQDHGVAATGHLDAGTIAELGMIEGPVGGTPSRAGGSVGTSR